MHRANSSCCYSNTNARWAIGLQMLQLSAVVRRTSSCLMVSRQKTLTTAWDQPAYIAMFHITIEMKILEMCP